MDGRLPTKSMERKDSWTPELDQLLLDIVIEGLNEGMTQVACFAKAAERIGKSQSACAFRFNTTIRKQASEAIERAKESGKNKKNTSQNVSMQFVTDAVFTITDEKAEVDVQQVSEDIDQEVVESFQTVSDINELYKEIGQPSLETVIQLLQMIQKHNGLTEENTLRRKIDEIETLISAAFDQIEQAKHQLQVAVDELHSLYE
ncbi:hypothetical protein LSG31_08595 [Fodinisporobacter ferrooxydans]|uniref:RsfA family transcriptional regulator n=1 Tax=Fodinisporobacter ferrooxydans TaxID=2901836 RepID=A0ABY4CRH4_9BACL|nr:hypothetical protein LSG31_08595 [Alicyclobacillaceae bacterium MYW30-H2]